MKKQEHLTVVGFLKQSYEMLVQENKKLKQENKELASSNWDKMQVIRELKAQIKEYEKERNEVLRECVKLSKLVDKLRDAIEEEEN